MNETIWQRLAGGAAAQPSRTADKTTTSAPSGVGQNPDFSARSAASLDDDVSPCALDDGHDLGPLGRRDGELVERLRHVVHERVPLAGRNAKVPVRTQHVLAGVFLRTSGGPA